MTPCEKILKSAIEEKAGNKFVYLKRNYPCVVWRTYKLCVWLFLILDTSLRVFLLTFVNQYMFSHAPIVTCTNANIGLTTSSFIYRSINVGTFDHKSQ